MQSIKHYPALQAVSAALDCPQAQPWIISKPLEVIEPKRLTIPFMPQSRACASYRLYETVAIMTTAILCAFLYTSSELPHHPTKICLFMLSYNDEAALRLNLPLWRPYISTYIVVIDDRTTDLSEFVVAEQLHDMPGRVLRINTSPQYDDTSLHPFGARVAKLISNVLPSLPEVNRILIARSYSDI